MPFFPRLRGSDIDLVSLASLFSSCPIKSITTSTFSHWFPWLWVSLFFNVIVGVFSSKGLFIAALRLLLGFTSSELTRRSYDHFFLVSRRSSWRCKWNIQSWICGNAILKMQTRGWWSTSLMQINRKSWVQRFEKWGSSFIKTRYSIYLLFFYYSYIESTQLTKV